MSCVTANQLREATANPTDFEYLAVDEAQFFPYLIDVCDELNRLGKHIILAALCGDCRWVTLAYEIIPYVDDIIMLKAKCSDCSSPVASISRRRNRAEPFTVGGAETYISLCRECYYKWEDIDNKNGMVPTWEVAR